MLRIDGEFETLTAPPIAWPEAREPSGRTPLADLALPLALAIGAAGWDVEGFEVRLSDHAFVGKGRERHFGRVRHGDTTVEFGANEGTRTIVGVAFGANVIRWYDDSSSTGLKVTVVPADGAGIAQTLTYETASHGRGNFALRGVAVAGHPERHERDAMETRARAAVASLIRVLREASGHRRLDATAAGEALTAMRARAPIAPPDDMPALYAWVDRDQLRGFGRTGDKVLRPSVRLAPSGGEIGWMPHVYAGFDAATRAGHAVHQSGYEALPAVIRLRNLDGVFVVDNGAFDRARQDALDAAAAETPARDKLKDRELDAAIAAVVPTLVPYLDYVHGSYEKPVVVIRRELGPDEVSLVRGRVEASLVEHEGKGPRLRIVIASDDGLTFPIETGGGYGPKAYDSFFQYEVGSYVADLLGKPAWVDPALREALREHQERSSMGEARG